MTKVVFNDVFIIEVTVHTNKTVEIKDSFYMQ